MKFRHANPQAPKEIWLYGLVPVIYLNTPLGSLKLFQSCLPSYKRYNILNSILFMTKNPQASQVSKKKFDRSGFS